MVTRQEIIAITKKERSIMAILTDGRKTVEITMYTGGVEFSNDFFEVGRLEFADKDQEIYIVNDVDYCIEQANDWKNNAGDHYYEDADPEEIENREVYCEKIAILESVTIPDGVTRIEDGAFYNYRFLKNVTIPDGVTEIGEDAFNNCTSLENVTIPDSVNKIGDNAFAGCSSLKSVTIPESVEEIGYNAFRGCHSLKSITIPDSVKKIGEFAFAGCTSLKNVTIPNGVTDIRDCVFMYCYSLENVTIPNSVKKIGRWAFRYCHSLKSIKIPDSVAEIDGYAFDDHTSLEKCTFVSSEQLNSLHKSGINIEMKQTEDNRIIVKYKVADEQRVKNLIMEATKQNKHMKR